MFSKSFLKQLKINSIAEIYCLKADDCKWHEFFDEIINKEKSQNISYYGLNDDSKIIDHNREFFRMEKNKFFSLLNPIQDPLPCVDLMIINNIFHKLSKKEVWRFFSKIRDSKSRFLLIEIDKKDDKFILNQSPFSLPCCVVLNIEELNKKFVFFKLDEIAFLMSSNNYEIPELRVKFYQLMRNDFEYLQKIFDEKTFLNFIESFKKNWENHNEIALAEDVSKVLQLNNQRGFNIRNFYYRISYQVELDLVNSKFNLINNDNFYKIFLIFNDYLDFLLKDINYKISS